MASPPSSNLETMSLTQKASRYTLQFPEEDDELEDYTSVRLNYKPDSRGPNSSSTLQLNSTSANLTLPSSSSKPYKFTGEHAKLPNSYILLFDQSANTATLKPITDSYALNVTSTPASSNANKLSQQYPHISNDLGDSTASAILSSNTPAEESNPFDFRHYLHKKRSARSPSPNPAAASSSHLAPPKAIKGRERSVSAPQTPTVPAAASSKAGSRAAAARKEAPKILLERRASKQEKPAKKPPPKKAAPAARGGAGKGKKPLSKETIDSEDEVSDSELLAPPDAHASVLTIEEEPEPASVPLPDEESDEDDYVDRADRGAGGGLEIIFGSDDEEEQTSARHRPRPRASTLPKSGGPISLRSAANSPLSAIGTPRASGPVRLGGRDMIAEENEEEEEEEEEAEEIDLGRGRGRDGDVEPLELDAQANEVDAFEQAMMGEMMGDDSEESEAE